MRSKKGGEGERKREGVRGVGYRRVRENHIRKEMETEGDGKELVGRRWKDERKGEKRRRGEKGKREEEE